MSRLFLDQFGGRWRANSRKDLARQIPGRISIMYRDKPDGTTVRCGYVVGSGAGQLWLTEYAPVERPV